MSPLRSAPLLSHVWKGTVIYLGADCNFPCAEVARVPVFLPVSFSFLLFLYFFFYVRRETRPSKKMKERPCLGFNAYKFWRLLRGLKTLLV